MTSRRQWMCKLNLVTVCNIQVNYFFCSGAFGGPFRLLIEFYLYYKARFRNKIGRNLFSVTKHVSFVWFLMMVQICEDNANL